MKKKFILKFLTGTAFNVIMGVILASMVGISPAYGAASGIVVPMLLKGFMPAGAAMEGVYTEVWTGELVRQLDAGLTASFLDGIPDYSARVNNEIIHLVDVGADPDVLVNNTTYPIPIQNLEENDIPIGLDKFQTKATRVTDDQLYAISYDKFSLDVERHRNAIDRIRYKKAAHALAPYSHTGKTPVIPTSGEADATGRKKLTLKDIIALKRALDNAEVPEDGRRLVLCPDHVNDLLEQDQSFKDKFYNYTSGKLLNMYGFQIYTFINCPYYTNEGVKVPYNQTPGERILRVLCTPHVPCAGLDQDVLFGCGHQPADPGKPGQLPPLLHRSSQETGGDRSHLFVGRYHCPEKGPGSSGRETVGRGETGSDGGSESESRV